MRNNRTYAILIQALLTVLIVVTLTVYGCTAGRQSIGPELKPAALPTYEEGTTFIYSDRSWETITAAAPGTVSWIDHRGKVSSGSPDFIYRRANWQTRTRRGRREFKQWQHIFSKSDLSLWPLSEGNIMRYSEYGTWFDKEGLKHAYRSNWVCRVSGTERVTVMAGEFNTWKIVCERYTFPRGKRKPRLREVKTYYYSPRVKHYILASTRYMYNRSPRRLELLPFCRQRPAFQTRQTVEWTSAFKKPWSLKSATNPLLGRYPA